VGLGLHLLTGSTNVAAIRTFADTINYHTSTAKDQVAYHGSGASASVLLDVTRDLRVAGWLRSDSKLRGDINGQTVAENHLPHTFGAGAEWRAGAQATFAGTVMWQNWASAASPADSNTHDTFNWSLGAEIGSLSSPFRLGIRGGQLPFGVGKTPTEVGYTAGLGRQFSGGRGRLDFGLERLDRKGTGLSEHVWTFLVGLTVRP
jgi:hypothetical protein